MSITKVTYSMIDSAPVNVADYGASPSAIASVNDAAFAAALAASDNIIIPSGNYQISTTLFFNRHKIIGAGANVTSKGTTITMVADAPIFQFNGGYTEGCRISGIILFYGHSIPAAGSTKIGINIPNVSAWPSNFEFSDLWILGAQIAVNDPSGSYIGKYFQVRAENCRTGFVKVSGTTMVYEQCYVKNCYQSWSIADVFSVTLISCAFDGCNDTAVNQPLFFASGVSGLVILGMDQEVNYVSRNLNSIMRIFSCYGFQFSGIKTFGNKLRASTGENYWMEFSGVSAGEVVACDSFQTAYDYSGGGTVAYLAVVTGSAKVSFKGCNFPAIIQTTTPASAISIGDASTGPVTTETTTLGNATLGSVIPLDNISSGTWTPTLTGYTIVGSPIITGKYVRNGNTVHCWILIDTSVGNTVQSIAGTSRISNFPLNLAPTIRSTCTASDEAITSYGVGAVSPADGAYTPSWPAGTNNIYIYYSYYIGA